jgi:Lon protease-like protein
MLRAGARVRTGAGRGGTGSAALRDGYRGAVAEAIPLFPLSHVLLPGMPLPLHIFEQRYRDLLDDVSGSGRTAAFGVVALRRGTEAVAAGTDNGVDVEEVGTLAEILEIDPNDDGTSDVLSVGSRRFRVLRLLPDDGSYLRAEVEFLDEPDGELTAEQERRARELLDVFDSLLVRLAGRATGSELPDDANQLSYQVAARLPLAPIERQQLLADDTTATRLKRVARLLRREIALLRRTRSIAVSPAVVRLPAGLN